MSTMYGADVAQLRALAAQFDRVADQLENGRVGVGSMVRSNPWSGPDAALFRSDWDHQHSNRLSQAASLLRDGARKLRGNADAQEQASAVDGGSGWAVPPGWPGHSGIPAVSEAVQGDARWREALDWIERVKGQQPGETGWSWGDLAGLVPKLGTASDVLAAADKISDGKVPWHEAADFVGGLFKERGTPLTYGIGLNVSLWSDVIDLGTNGDIDWSAKGMQDAFNGLFNADAWKEVGHDLATKLPPLLAGDFAWW